MDNQFNIVLPVTLILGLSLALFGAFRAGQLVERKRFLQELENFELEKVKLKTEAKLQLLCIEHRNGSNPLEFPVPNEPNIDHIRDFLSKFFLVNETLREQI
nr:cytoplasmic male sterility-associated protein [Solanum melongena]WMB97075.1 cytoplasmic male sterility-associated protein [Solanum aethiopicum]